jgi:hypothetical protein
VVVLRFRLPGSADELTVESSARVPAITWHYGSSVREDTESWTAKW